MSPTLVLLGDEPVLVLGSPGGDTIPNTVVLVLLNVVVYGMSLSQAFDVPRVHHGFTPDHVLYVSSRPPSRVLEMGLERRGHAISGARTTIGDANNVMAWRGTLWGYADPREGGLAQAPEPTATAVPNAVPP
jgi:gamma-glutamyltranspeptidase/glutathione hydrolase